jgi:hypothetical protein
MRLEDSKADWAESCADDLWYLIEPGKLVVLPDVNCILDKEDIIKILGPVAEMKGM